MSSICVLQYLMIEANSFKQLKGGPNCYSPRQHVETENSTKKKLFSRKPALNNPSIISQNKRKVAVAVEGIKTAKSIVYSPLKDKALVEAPSNMVAITRKQRQTENFYKDKELVNQFGRKYQREMLYSPKSQKNLLQLEIKPNTFSKKQLDQANFDQQFKRKTGPSNVYDRAKQALEVDQGLIDNAFENESIQSFKNSKTASNTSEKAVSYKRLLSPNYPTVSKDKIEDKIQTRECFYCKNNKLIVDILTEKQRKLEDQYRAKAAVTKEFMDKCELLKKENGMLISKMEKNVQIFQAKEAYFYREKDELIGKIQLLKKDVVKLNQRVKYEQIQNSMLLRYKDEYQLLTQQFDTLRHDNQIIKRQLTTYQNQNQNRFNFSKGKQPGVGQKPESDKKYQFYNKIIAPKNEIRTYSREDDDVSLTFSQQSFQQV